MTQDRGKDFVSTRVLNAEPDLHDPSQPRIGRRESEPHSAEITYIYDVLKTNFPQHHPLWDLHHCFQYENEEIDVLFDISFFLNYSIPTSLSSYNASEHGNRIPNLAINILSKSTWRSDFSENLEFARMLKIPVYVVFAPFDVATRPYQPPLARAYLLQPDGNYRFIELRTAIVEAEITSPFPSHQQLDTGTHLPFNFSLVKLDKTHEKQKPLYRLVLIDKETSNAYLSKIELQGQTIEREKQRAEQEKQLADQYLALLRKNGLES